MIQVRGKARLALVFFPALPLALPLALLTPAVSAGTQAAKIRPAIAIIIDDLGYTPVRDLRAMRLPGRLTLSFLPHGPHSKRLAALAHRQGKEIMLHLPMEAVGGRTLGPGALTLRMTEPQFKASVKASLASIPHVRGVNNHMGSLLTRHPGHMAWLMETLLEAGGLYFVDSRTTSATVAATIAREYGLPAVSRDVFIDTEPNDAAYAAEQFGRLLKIAREQGLAAAIAHPYPQTLALLEERLPLLEAEGVRLVSIGELLELQQRRQTWQASSSPSPKTAKSSKPLPSSIY